MYNLIAVSPFLRFNHEDLFQPLASLRWQGETVFTTSGANPGEIDTKEDREATDGPYYRNPSIDYQRCLLLATHPRFTPGDLCRRSLRELKPLISVQVST